MPEKKITAVEVSEDVQAKFWEYINTTDLERNVTFEFISIEKLKSVVKIEIPSNKSTLKMKTGVDVFIHVDEAIFNGLNEEMQKILIQEAITEVVYDDDADKVIKDKKDVTTFSGVIRKYGDQYLDMLKAIDDVQKQFAEKEKEEKSNAKGKEIKDVK